MSLSVPCIWLSIAQAASTACRTKRHGLRLPQWHRLGLSAVHTEVLHPRPSFEPNRCPGLARCQPALNEPFSLPSSLSLRPSAQTICPIVFPQHYSWKPRLLPTLTSPGTRRTHLRELPLFVLCPVSSLNQSVSLWPILHSHFQIYGLEYCCCHSSSLSMLVWWPILLLIQGWSVRITWS